MLKSSQHSLPSSLWPHGRAPRFYYLPISNHCVSGCYFCRYLGCCREAPRTISQIESSLTKAVVGEFDAVLFTSALIEHPNFEEIIKLAKNRGLEAILQLPISYASLLPPEKLQQIAKAGLRLNILLGCRHKLALGFIDKISNISPSFYITLVVEKGTPVETIINSIPDYFRERIFFYFPYKLRPQEDLFSCREVARIVRKLKIKFTNLCVRPPLGQDIWDRRVHPLLALEPHLLPDKIQELPNSEILISVIIPTYNNGRYLINTLRHLAQQSLKKENFEIIVVDDGSNDSSDDRVDHFLKSSGDLLNFKYIYSPRPAARTMGDSNYRAGVSRNLGVKNSVGSFLCFLDSDILTPPNFLEDLLEKHKKWDVIQCKRFDLNRTASLSEITYASVNPNRDLQGLDPYWDKFFQSKNWMATQHFWKYTCTYGLSMRTAVFKNSGWIRRNFVYYGFEDVELGYRLFKDGYSFLLNDVITYHLYHEHSRSEFYNDPFRRNRLLKHTAQIFFLNTLDLEVFDELNGFMSESYRMKDWFIFFGNKLSGNKAGKNVS